MRRNDAGTGLGAPRNALPVRKVPRLAVEGPIIMVTYANFRHMSICSGCVASGSGGHGNDHRARLDCRMVPGRLVRRVLLPS